MEVALVGGGAVGSRVARQLVADALVDGVTLVHRDADPMGRFVGELGARLHLRRSPLTDLPAVDVVVVTIPRGVRRVVQAAIDIGAHVVCCVDDPDEIRQVRALDDAARSAGRCVAVGAAMAPGLSGVLAAYAAGELDRVEEIHVASFGTGGPACARRHHRALSSTGVLWEQGGWARRPGGSGRELVWFPEPVGGADCYLADLADPLLLAEAFPEARRITARLHATRRDRFTAWLPMLRPPHPEGLLGGVRVEVRGRLGTSAETVVVGSAGRPAVVAGTVAAVTASWAATGRLRRPGAGGLSILVDQPGAFLAECAARGVPVSTFAGADGE